MASRRNMSINRITLPIQSWRDFQFVFWFCFVWANTPSAASTTTSICWEFIYNLEVFRWQHISRVSVKVSTNYALDFFGEYAQVVHCVLSGDNVEVARQLAFNSIQSRFIDRFDNIPNLVDTPPTTIQSYVVNMACENHQRIYPQADGKVLFKNNNFWLFIDFDGDDGDDGIPVCRLCDCMWWKWWMMSRFIN